MPGSEKSRSSNDIKQTLRLPDSADESCGTDQTLDSELYATIKNGTANITHLRVIVPGFEIIEELGRGAFGVVYRARDVKLDRHVAIKVSLLDDPSRREQYIREARNAAKLEALGIVPVFQVGALRDGQPFVVQRLIDGQSLRKLLADEGAVDLHRACQLMIDIAEAMAHAHALGMIHRDLKPDNILIDAAGRPWVADFGLAILEEDQSQHRGERAGTPLYMSPEQLRGRTEWLDGRTDIYALGVMWYEMLSGRPPFDANNLAELEEQVLHRDPKPITQRVGHLPAAVDVIFQNCCAKQVNDRYANAHELVADLQLLMAELTQSNVQLGPPELRPGGAETGRQSTPLPVPVRRRTLLQSGPGRTTEVHAPRVPSRYRYSLPIGGVAVLAIVLATVAGFKLWPQPEHRLLDGMVPLDTAGVGTLPLPEPLSEVLSDIPPAPEFSRPDPPAAATPSLQPDAALAESSSGESPPRQSPVVESPSPSVPPRPLRVSKGSAGTHTTIQAAIAAAQPGETITVLPGNYVETLRLTRSLTLVGQGNREQIVIVGENQSALVVEGEASITLNNLTLEGIKSGEAEINTIDVQQGMLTLQDCVVNSRSFDCIKLQPGSGLSASHCRFRTMVHPAISADQVQELTLLECSFDIRPPTQDSSSIPVGVQATHSAGTIRKCSFMGAGAAVGVHWQDTQQRVVIEDCSFENCEFGLVIQKCEQFSLVSNDRTQLRGCHNGLLLDHSSASISGIEIHGSSGKQGIRIVDSRELGGPPRIALNDCDISGFDESLCIERAHVLVKNLNSGDSDQAGVKVAAQGHLSLFDSTISNGELTGILIEDGTAQLTNCQLINHAYAGIFVDSHTDSLTAEGCLFRDNTSGLLVASGTVSLKGGTFVANMVGILVSSRELLGQAATGDPVPIFIDINDVAFDNNKSGGMVVRAPCSYRIVRAADERRGLEDVVPKVLGELKAAQVGDTTVVKPLASGGKKL